MKKAFRTGFLGLSALYALLGLILIIWPDVAKGVICTVAGIACILFGLYRLVTCLRSQTISLIDGGATLGVVLIMLGVLVLVKTDAIVTIIMALIGIGIAADGFVKLQLAFMLRRAQSVAWKRSVIIAAVVIAIGLFFVFDPFAGVRTMTIIVGAVMLLNGICDALFAYEVNKSVETID